jgi:hypothetical protein
MMCWVRASGADRLFLLSRSAFAENYVRRVHFRWSHLSR